MGTIPSPDDRLEHGGEKTTKNHSLDIMTLITARCIKYQLANKTCCTPFRESVIPTVRQLS
jgi:hypothetical protein